MKKTIAGYLFCFFCLFAFSQNKPEQFVGTAQKRPNIILILADDLGYETLGCNGNDDLMTPNLDLLAKTGMRFDYCYSMPLCTPSRVQLMTGKYNHRNYTGFGLLDPGQVTFGTLIKNQGYKTCIAGKWQLLGNKMQQELAGGKTGTLPQATGFDKYCLWQVDSGGSRYSNPTIYMPPGVSKKWEGRYGPDVYTSYIEDFMEENASQPFFVYYPMCLPHDPFVPTPFSDKDGKSPKDKNGYFKDMVHYMDYLVGRLVAKLDQLEIRDNTVIIFSGDNGTSPGITSNFKGGKVQGNKGRTNDRGTHVPLIVNWKGSVTEGVVNDNLVDFTDFFPTLLDLAKVKRTEAMKLDGISFYPQLKNLQAAKRQWVFCHYDPRWGKFTEQTFVHDKEWKVYKSGEIYDLLRDPDELQPLKSTALSAEQKRKTQHFMEILNQTLNHSK